MNILENESLARHTTYHVGGPARYFIDISSDNDLLKSLKFAKDKNLPFFILGNGSNTLFCDDGFQGVVLHMADRAMNVEGNVTTAASGVFMRQLINTALDHGLTGLEDLAGIPGTIGGAVRGNAGTWHTEIKDIVRTIEVVDAEDIENGVQIFQPADCSFGYRHSIFKTNKNLIITRASFEGTPGNVEEARQLVEKDRLQRHEKQPYNYPSAGSVFKNPDPVNKIFAGALIEQCGLKGHQIGGAKISEKHANFIVNTGSATASDIFALIDLIKSTVKANYDITLEPEIEIVRA